jgi:hypothetical protein
MLWHIYELFCQIEVVHNLRFVNTYFEAELS